MKIKYPYTKPQSPTPFNSNSYPSHFCTKLWSKTYPFYLGKESSHLLRRVCKITGKQTSTSNRNWMEFQYVESLTGIILLNVFSVDFNVKPENFLFQIKVIRKSAKIVNYLNRLAFSTDFDYITKLP